LSALENISKGTFIIEFSGEVFISESKYGKETLKKAEKSNCSYLMKLSDKNQIVDPTYKGNLARFINHS
jgi:SET domain-containing protein